MAFKVLGFTLPFTNQKSAAPENAPPAAPSNRGENAGGWLENALKDKEWPRDHGRLSEQSAPRSEAEWPRDYGKLSDGKYSSQIFDPVPKQPPTGPVASLKDMQRTNVSLEVVDTLEGSKTLREEVQRDIDLVRREGGFANLQTGEVNGKPVHLLFTSNKVTAYYDDVFPRRQVGVVGRDQSVTWQHPEVAFGNAAMYGGEGVGRLR